MNWFLGILVILILIFLRTNYLKKKKLKNLKQKLIKNWGKKKEKEYFNFYSISRYFENNKHKNKAFHIISEKTKNDLDIDELFKYIDRTSSKIGQQYLYFKLRTIDSIKMLLQFDSLSELFLKNNVLRINCQLYLSHLNANSSYNYEELINGKQVEKSKNIWLLYSLSISVIILIGLGFFKPIFYLAILLIYIVNLFFHLKNKSNISYYLEGVTELSKSLKVAKNLSKQKEIKQYYKDFTFISKINTIKLKTEFIGFEKQLNNEFAFVFWFIIEQFKILFNLEYLIFYSFIDSITNEKESIEKMYEFIGEIDSAISTASLKSDDLKICVPVFNGEKEVSVKNIIHPLIKNCIPNDLDLQNKSMLLTGSNMSGKTTFIRTFGINSILAQTLNICFAEKYNAPFFKIYTSIRISDDLLNNKSYYLEEVLTIKKLINKSIKNSKCLFILDEIFKGTNTIERISGGKAILSYLNKQKNIVLVSTHDIELTELLEKDFYELFHFSENIKEEELIFDHKLKKGKLKTRNAIKILELYNYPKEIIINAQKIEKITMANNVQN